MKHEELIERLQGLDGPDREVDAEIWLNFVASPDQYRLVEVGRAKIGEREASDRISMMSDGLDYTASIDAALTLVPEGWDLDLFVRSKYHRATMENGDFDSEVEAINAPTPAIAIVIAALRARGEG